MLFRSGAMLSKMPGDLWQKFANARLLYAFMYAHPGKKLLFMGCEIGQWNEWNCNESMDWHLLKYEHHQKLQYFFTKLNAVYKQYLPMHEIDFSWDGFEWIDLHDSENSTVSLIRKAKNYRHIIVCIFNFTPVVRQGYRVGVPYAGEYTQILNTDSEAFGGSNAGVVGTMTAEATPWNSHQYSLPLNLPPLGAVFFHHYEDLPPALEAEVVEQAAEPAGGPGGGAAAGTSSAATGSARPETAAGGA